MALQTKPRFEKSTPYGGTFVAPLAVDLDEAAHGNKVIGVGLNSAGAITIGGGQTGIIGVILPVVGTNPYSGGLLEGQVAGDPLDVMVQGEIINYKYQNGTVPPLGTKVYSSPAGVLSAAPVDGSVLIGWTLPADGYATNGVRLFVNVMAPAVPLDIA